MNERVYNSIMDFGVKTYDLLSKIVPNIHYENPGKMAKVLQAVSSGLVVAGASQTQGPAKSVLYGASATSILTEDILTSIPGIPNLGKFVEEAYEGYEKSCATFGGIHLALGTGKIFTGEAGDALSDILVGAGLVARSLSIRLNSSKRKEK